MNALKKVDFLFLVYIAVSTFLLFFTGDPGLQLSTFILVRVFMVTFVFALIYADKKITGNIIKLFRYAYPILVSGYFYSETVYYNKLFFKNLDPILMDIDQAVFTFQPSLEFSAYFSNKLFSELMYFGYFSFYLLILGFILYVFSKNRAMFNQLSFQLVVSLYAFYFVFCFFPSEGPQFYFSFPEKALPDAYVFDRVMHFIQRVAEKPTGAFPSSHVGVSVIILMLSKKYLPGFFKFAWPAVVVLVLSTVYIKAHYAIDVIGGIVAAPFIQYLSKYLYYLPCRESLK